MSHDHLDATGGIINMAAGSILSVSNPDSVAFTPFVKYDNRIGTAADYMNGANPAPDGLVFGTRAEDGTLGGAGGVVINPSNSAGPTESSLFRQGEFLVRRFTPVPEPASVTAIFAAGLGGVTWLRRRRQPTSAAVPSSPIVGGMKLQPWQAEKVGRAVRPMVGYLSRLRRRMEQTFDPGDPLYRHVCAAFDALHAPSVDLHYRACDGGTGRPPGN